MSNSWIIVQDAKQVYKSLLLEKVSQPMAYCFLATTPGAYFDMEKYGLPVRSTHEFTSTNDLNCIAWQNYQRVRYAVHNLESLLHVQIPDLPKDFRPFEAAEYQIKHFTDSIAFTLKELIEFCRAELPTKLLYWSNNCGMDGSPEVHFLKREKIGNFSFHPNDMTVASLILSNPLCWERLSVVPERLSIGGSTCTASPKLGWCCRISQLLNPNRRSVRTLLSGIMRTALRSKGQRLLVIGIADNSISFIKHAQSRYGVHVDWWTHYASNPIHLPTFREVSLDSSTDKSLKPMVQVARLSPPFEIKALWEFSEDDQPILDILWDRLVNFWKRRVPYLLLLYLRAIHYFEKYKPVAVLCGTTPEEAQVIFQAAKVCEVPSVSFQHGGGFGYLLVESTKLSDLRADFYAGYGPEGCRNLEKFAKNYGLTARAISIGWSRGAEIKAHARSSRSVGRININLQTLPHTAYKLIYATTNLSRDHRYGPYHFSIVHDTEYCLHQVQVIKVLSQLPDTYLLIKFNNKGWGENPVEHWVSQQKNSRMGMLKQGNFSTFLPWADLVVLDSPGTTLIEAMAAGKRVVYLDIGIFRWTSEGEALMRKTTIWVDKDPGWEEHLCKAIVELLKVSPPELTTNAFLAAYASLNFRPELLWEKLITVR